MSKVHDQAAELADIPIDRVSPNEDNPRLTFRPGELDELQESIRQYGIQVPVAVYRKGRDSYILIDGERRWRCALKLNLATIPAIIRDQPGPLENLLLMFNIHALREQWDLLTIALKLPKLINLLEEELGKEPTEAQIAARAGLNRSLIRRCRLLTNLPKKYQSMLLEELKKPKPKQTISEDFFIEMEKALITVERAMPDVIPDKNKARDALLTKYKNKVIPNLVDLRKVGKIARASKTVGTDEGTAKKALKKLIEDPKYSIENAWSSVSEAYVERDILSRIEHLLTRLGEFKEVEIDDDVREKLQELVNAAQAILEADV